jgi:hypothetical protein
VQQLVQQLKQQRPQAVALPTSGPLSGNWRLIYTTEAGERWCCDVRTQP